MPRKRAEYKAGEELPAGDHLVRHCKSGWVIKDRDNNPTGITRDAFKLAIDKTTGKLEEGLSCCWLEYFEKDSVLTNLELIKKSMNRNFNNGDHLAVWLTDKVIETCDAFGQKIKIVYRPTQDKAHSQIENILDNNNFVLQEKIALETVSLHHAKITPTVTPETKKEATKPKSR